MDELRCALAMGCCRRGHTLTALARARCLMARTATVGSEATSLHHCVHPEPKADATAQSASKARTRDRARSPCYSWPPRAPPTSGDDFRLASAAGSEATSLHAPCLAERLRLTPPAVRASSSEAADLRDKPLAVLLAATSRDRPGDDFVIPPSVRRR